MQGLQTVIFSPLLTLYQRVFANPSIVMFKVGVTSARIELFEGELIETFTTGGAISLQEILKFEKETGIVLLEVNKTL